MKRKGIMINHKGMRVGRYKGTVFFSTGGDVSVGHNKKRIQ